MLKGLTKKQNKELEYLGYTRLGVMPHLQFKELKKESDELVKEVRAYYKTGELLSLINAEHRFKLKSNEMVNRYLNNYLETVLDLREVDIYAVSHILKPFGLKGGICHQDSCIVEEPTHFSLNAWMSLFPSHRLNGCLWVLPGSQIFEHYTRPFIPNPFFGKPITKVIWKKMKPLPSIAGEIILFHRSLLHGSSRNFLPYTRVAIESVIIPKDAGLVQYRLDDSVSKDKILKYRVRQEHFLKPVPKEDFINKVYDYELCDHPDDLTVVQKLENSFSLFERQAHSLYQ